MTVNVGQRNVPDTPQNRGLIALNNALNLNVHTIKICSNPKVFDDCFKAWANNASKGNSYKLINRTQEYLKKVEESK
jgi:hypothetical protein